MIQKLLRRFIVNKIIGKNKKKCFFCNKIYTYEKFNLRFCYNHKIKGSNRVSEPICCKCKKIAFYTHKFKKYCFKHKTNNCKKLKRRFCLICGKVPYYKNDDLFFCCKHKNENSIFLYPKKCILCNNMCKTCGYYCSEHERKKVLCLYSKCNIDRCKWGPTYNYRGNINPLYCCRHKTDEMVYIKNEKCISCDNVAVFGVSTVASSCVIHKTEFMIPVKLKKCEENNCECYAFYNYENEEMRTFCYKHKKDGMIRL